MTNENADRVTNVPLVSTFTFHGVQHFTVSVSGIGARP